MLLIAVVGMAGSGKTTLCKHLEEVGFPVLRLGSLLTEEVTRRRLEPTAANKTQVRLAMFEESGADALAQMALPWLRARECEDRAVVLEGPYSYVEYQRLRREFGDGLVLIAVMVSRRKRHQRLVARKERPITYQRAQERDSMEVEQTGRPQLIALADCFLLNDGDDVDAYLQQALGLIRTIAEAHAASRCK